MWKWLKQPACQRERDPDASPAPRAHRSLASDYATSAPGSVLIDVTVAYRDVYALALRVTELQFRFGNDEFRHDEEYRNFVDTQSWPIEPWSPLGQR